MAGYSTRNVSVLCFGTALLLLVGYLDCRGCRSPTVTYLGGSGCSALNLTDMASRRSLVLFIKGISDVAIGLGKADDPYLVTYMVHIGRDGNSKTSFSLFLVCGRHFAKDYQIVQQRGALTPDAFRAFWLQWKVRGIAFGQGDQVGTAELLHYKDLTTDLHVKQIFLASLSNNPFDAYYIDDSSTCTAELVTASEKSTISLPSLASPTEPSGKTSREHTTVTTLTKAVMNATESGHLTSNNRTTAAVTDAVNDTDQVTVTAHEITQPANTTTVTETMSSTTEATHQISTNVTAVAVTDAVSDTYQPTDQVTDTVYEINHSTDRVTDTANETNQSTDRVTDTVNETNQSTDRVTDTVNETNQSTDRVTDTVNETNQSTDRVTDTVNETNQSTDRVTDTVNETNQSTDRDTDTADETKQPTDHDHDQSSEQVIGSPNDDPNPPDPGPSLSPPPRLSKEQRSCKCVRSEPGSQAEGRGNSSQGSATLVREKKKEALSRAIVKELAVGKTNLSSSVRKKSSSADKRPSVSAIGYALGAVSFAPFVCIFVADAVKGLWFVWRRLAVTR